MGRIIKSFGLLFIMMYFERIAGQDDNSSIIVLEYFQQPFIWDMQTTGLEKCQSSCDGLTSQSATIKIDPFFSSTCYGKFDDCIILGIPDNKDLVFCKNTTANAGVWFHEKKRNIEYGRKSDCGGSTEVHHMTWTKNDVKCPVCACTCYEAESDMASLKGRWWFSTIEQTCDEDKVVTGVRFREINHTIYMQIKENTFPIEGPGNWKELTTEAESDDGAATKTKVLLTDKFRTILLDEIDVGAESLITGVRFVETVVPGKSTPALRLEVQSRLINDEEKKVTWLPGQTAKLKGIVKWSSVTGQPHVLPHVKFGIGSLQKDLGKSTEPSIYGFNVESEPEISLRGIQLMLVNVSNGQQIYPRVAALGSKPDAESAEGDDEDDDEDEDEEQGDSANTATLQFLLIAIVPLSIIFNLFD